MPTELMRAVAAVRRDLDELKRLKKMAGPQSWAWSQVEQVNGEVRIPNGTRLGNSCIVLDEDCIGDDAAACLLISKVMPRLDAMILLAERFVKLNSAATEFVALAQLTEIELASSDIDTKPIECARKRMESALGLKQKDSSSQ